MSAKLIVRSVFTAFGFAAIASGVWLMPGDSVWRLVAATSLLVFGGMCLGAAEQWR